MYEEGSQVRRSSKSVCAQIAEGYSLRVYKKEFLLFLHRAYASAQETIEHLDLLKDTGSLTDDHEYDELREKYNELCGMLFRLIQSVAEGHDKPYSLREETSSYDP
jgi:four helix bundle protein